MIEAETRQTRLLLMSDPSDSITLYRLSSGLVTNNHRPATLFRRSPQVRHGKDPNFTHEGVMFPICYMSIRETVQLARVSLHLGKHVQKKLLKDINEMCLKKKAEEEQPAQESEIKQRQRERPGQSHHRSQGEGFHQGIEHYETGVHKGRGSP